MEILVNREPLDFSLENESSLGEVIDELADWLRSGRFAITSLDVNDRTYAIHDRDAWADIALHTVREISVEALPLSEADHATLIALDEYCALLAHALETRNDGPIGELAEELPYVRGRLAGYFPSLADENGRVAVCSNRELESGILPDPEAAEAILAEITDIRTILQTREREYREPERELALSLGQLAAAAVQLIEVPVQLQTGDETTAMQTIVRLTELLTRVMRLVPLVEASAREPAIDIAGVRRFAEEITPQLSELKDAFEMQDSVLIGDLLEYEVAPRLEKLERLLPDQGGDA